MKRSYKQRLIEAMEAFDREHPGRRPHYEWLLIDLKRKGSGRLSAYWYAIGQELGVES